MLFGCPDNRYVKNQRLSTILVLLMLITPVASALSGCYGMMDFCNSDLLLASKDQPDKATGLAHKGSDHLKHQNPSGKHCDTDGNCTFHYCGGWAMTSSISYHCSYDSYYHPDLGGTPILGISVSPEIKPPILTLC